MISTPNAEAVYRLPKKASLTQLCSVFTTAMKTWNKTATGAPNGQCLGCELVMIDGRAYARITFRSSQVRIAKAGRLDPHFHGFNPSNLKGQFCYCVDDANQTADTTTGKDNAETQAPLSD